MLKSLTVANYALIEKVEISFYSGFSVITGETGAGKSILLGALGLIMGQRADALVLRDKEQKCAVEAQFDISGYQIEGLLAENDLDFEPITIIRREVLPTGKSRAFINDTPVNLNVLKDVASRLIDIHSQHQTLLLGENHFQLGVVDAVANSQAEKSAYTQVFNQYKKLLGELSDLKTNSLKQKDELDYLQYQYQQLVGAKLVEGEQPELELRLQELTHAAEIKLALQFAVENLNGDNLPVLVTLKDIQSQLTKIAGFLPGGHEFLTRIETAYLDLKDMAGELAARSEHIEHNVDDIERIQSRLGVLFELQQKHRVATVEELIKLQAELKQRLDLITGFDDQIAALTAQIDTVSKELLAKAQDLSAKRKSVFAFIEKSLVDNLVELGMPSARFVVSQTAKSEFGPDGTDDIVFLFSANKASQPSSLEKVASGGEMSRLMLCIKAMLSEAKGLPTLILDEIDTGVSGEIADKMGGIMGVMAKNMQVITITHLPQIAGRGNVHYKVSKLDKGDFHTSVIEELADDQRVVEIAKMLSGSEMSDAALSNAKALLRKV